MSALSRTPRISTLAPAVFLPHLNWRLQQKLKGTLMIRPILSAAALSFALVTAAWAVPAAPTTELPALNHSDVIQVKKGGGGHHGGGHHGGGKHYGGKHYGGKHYNHRYHGGKYYGKRGRYYHGGRYWGHRYNYRPYGWQTLGCLAVGPVWYCP
jgi:hypothetical protein